VLARGEQQHSAVRAVIVVLGKGLDEEHRCPGVDRPGQVQALGGDLVEATHRGHRVVDDEHVDSAEAIDRVVDHSARGVGGGEVRLDVVEAISGIAQLVDHRAQPAGGEGPRLVPVVRCD
jgi:hypothetical protein